LKKYEFDYLIIGSGLAGLYAAICAAEKGSVCIVSKSGFDISSSYWAQGGIAAALDPKDSYDLHMKDTMITGRGLCNKQFVEVLVKQGKERIKDLIEMGMKFDTEQGRLALGLEGGHSRRRVVRAGGNSTGKEIVNFLVNKILADKRIKIFEHTNVYRLCSVGSKCCGAFAVSLDTKELYFLKAKATILATGGASGIYSRNTNPHSSTGDGIALGYNAGAVLSDMEFIQFHPTAFYSETGKTFLVSEAVRGEGAHLVNRKGERFMLTTHPDAELAPRDVVSRAIYEELISSGEKCVFLKLNHLNAAEVELRFSNIYANAIQFGIDITTDPVPVAPAAHYMIGGIKAGLNAETNIEGLYVCGETAATGVHGANRLASNSLLECLVFAKRAVDNASEHFHFSSVQVDEDQNISFQLKYEQQFLEKKLLLAEIMNKYVGIVRSDYSLASAVSEIQKINAEVSLENSDYFSNKLSDLITICELMTKAASLRKETRGVHVRETYKHEDPTLLYHINFQKGKEPTFSHIK
jgi:L-aspartate oxidase